jgi:hypothetical protein
VSANGKPSIFDGECTLFHIAAFRNAALGTTADTDINALTDGVLSVSNNHFRLVDAMSLVAAAFMSPTAIRARLDSPSLRIMGRPQILPVNVGVTPVDRGKIMELWRNPLRLPQREEIALQGTANPGTTEVAVGAIIVSPGIAQPPPGQVQWVRATSTGTATSGAWTNVALTFDSSLPSGYYSVVGSEHESANAQLHRLIFPGQVYRPGFTSRTAEGNQSPNLNYFAYLGEMGRFVNDNPFQCEVLCNGADASHVFYFGLVPVASL